MPHDRNGNEVKNDDLVAIPFRVIRVSEGPTCSATLESIEAIQGDYKITITVNAKDIRVRPKLEETADDPARPFDFGHALYLLKSGKRVARSGWSKGMWLRLVHPYSDPHFKITEAPEAEGTLMSYIGMKTAENGFVPWLASQTDLYNADWIEIPAMPSRGEG